MNICPCKLSDAKIKLLVALIINIVKEKKIVITKHGYLKCSITNRNTLNTHTWRYLLPSLLTHVVTCCHHYSHMSLLVAITTHTWRYLLPSLLTCCHSGPGAVCIQLRYPRLPVPGRDVRGRRRPGRRCVRAYPGTDSQLPPRTGRLNSKRPTVPPDGTYE